MCTQELLTSANTGVAVKLVATRAETVNGVIHNNARAVIAGAAMDSA